MRNYRVTFINCIESTKEEFEYSNLMDALEVIRDTPIDGVTMLNKDFEDVLLQLLTSGHIHRGRQTTEYPDGEYLILLGKRLDNGAYEVIYGPDVIPFIAGLYNPCSR